MSTKIRLEVSLPDELLQAFLQHLRDFDTLHDPERKQLVHLAIGIEAPDLAAETIQGIFDSIRPPFEHRWVYQGAGKA
jgi:hypothetical protein